MKEGMSPLVIITVFNYNGEINTAECLDSVLRLNYPNYRIVIIDNGSTDASYGNLKKRYPELEFLEIKVNCGFVGAVNKALEYFALSGGDYIFLLSNDTTVNPGMLSELVLRGENDAKAGIIGPKVYYYHDPKRIYSAGGYVNFRTGIKGLIGAKQMDKGQFEIPRYVDYIAGCGMLVKREVYDRIGKFDSEYFMYSEESDYCQRAKSAGFQNLYVPDARMLHKVCGTNIYLSKNYIYYFIRNQLLFMKKHARWYMWPSFLIFFFAYHCLGYAVLLAQHRLFAVIPCIFRGVRDFFSGKYGDAHL